MNNSDKTLELLYPFLHGKVKDPQAENNLLLESIKQKSNQSLTVKETFFEDNAPALIGLSYAIAHVYRCQGRLFTMGNGGSSCDAEHFAVEFQHPVTAGRPALAAVNLAMDTAMITAVGNDIGIEHIFSRQIEAQGHAGDGLVGFSTSGNAKNLLSAFEKARQMKLLTIGFAGGDGGAMVASGLLDYCLVVKTDSIHRVQEVHVTAYHIIWDLVHTILADNRGAMQDNCRG